MGIINNIKMYFKRAEFNKDFNANDTLMKYYGEEATINSILEIKKMSSKRFAETIERAKIACEKSGHKIEDHFANVGKMVCPRCKSRGRKGEVLRIR